MYVMDQVINNKSLTGLKLQISIENIDINYIIFRNSNLIKSLELWFV